MKITDYKNLTVERSSEFLYSDMCGTVIKGPDAIGLNVYGVYIPRLMAGIIIKDGPYEKTLKLSADKCLNSVNNVFGESEVIYSNYILLTLDIPYNFSMPKLIDGETVTVGVVDQDIKSMYIKPFTRDQILNRPTDVMEMYVPASGKYEGLDINDSNSYFLRLDSKSKKIRLHMSKKNGEKTSYDLIFDGDGGFISIGDSERSFIINTDNDELMMKNKAGSSISLRGDAIDFEAKKIYINGADAVEMTSPKLTAELDNVSLKSKIFEGEITSMTLKGDKLSDSFSIAEYKNDKRNITSTTTTIDGLLEVSDFINANGGIGFGAPPGMAPLPVQPQISGSGEAQFFGAASLALAKAQPVMTLLQIIAAQADAAGVNGKVPIPPVASAAVAAMSSLITSSSAKG